MHAAARPLKADLNTVRQVRRFLAEYLGPGCDDVVWLTALVAQEIKDGGGRHREVRFLHMDRHVAVAIDYQPPPFPGDQWKPILSTALVAFMSTTSTQWNHTEEPGSGIRTLWLEIELDHPATVNPSSA